MRPGAALGRIHEAFAANPVGRGPAPAVAEWTAATLPALTDLVARFEPGQPLTHLAIAFTKDRTPDIDRGRFVDRAHGVLGYEWLHMLAALRSVLPDEDYRTYLDSRPSAADLWATYDPRPFVSALNERICLRPGEHRAVAPRTRPCALRFAIPSPLCRPTDRSPGPISRRCGVSRPWPTSCAPPNHARPARRSPARLP